MNQKLQQLLDSIQHSTHLSDDEKNGLTKTVKDADKELEITAFKLDRTEKVKRTTAILLEETIAELEQKRKAVEAQNLELEIESSLERVRTVAMSMNKPDDMLQICRIISEQLQHLNVQEIRNVQTAIFYETKGTYINYEFYAKHDKTLITEVDFKNHSVAKTFAHQMLKGPNEIFIHSFNGKEVLDWYEYQKTTNVFIDTYLEKASSLNYYWYSLGPVALGISTEHPLNKEETNLFKRFLKVFELSYRRYLDIEKAEAQAHEAKVEASLEKVRAVAMSMNKPDDLLNICETLFKEFNAFGFVDLRNAMINIHDDGNKTFVNYDYSDTIGKSTNHLAYDIHPVIKKQIKQIRWANDAFSETVFAGKDLTEWKKFRKKIGEKDDPRIKKARALYYYFYSIGTGSIGISTFSAVGKENLDLLKRYRNVFSLSYQRYTDLAMAEAQAREAQIELALERVRARTMAMQKSDELAETSFVLFQQFKDLGETSEQISIGIFNEDEHVMELYSTLYGSQWKDAVKVDLDEPVVMKKIHKAWKEQTRLPDGQEKSLVIDLSGKHLREYNAYRKKLSNLEYREDRWVIHIAFFSKGVLTFSTTDPHPHETIQLLERFAGVFDGTYTRFLDLQKAEAQARESQIELGLERVRARAMAMQSSNELSELVDTVFKELTKLDFALTWCIINIIDESSMSNTVWAANPDINKAPESYHMLFEDYPFHHAMMKGWKERKTKYVYVLEGQEKKIYDEYLFNETEFRRVPAAAQAASRTMEKYVVTFSFSNFGGLQTVGDAPLSDANLDILSRFGKVFDLTYTRFNDLKQAEAQARESQIQLALERVRARTMAMQKSDELPETSYLLFQQVKELGLTAVQNSIAIINEETGFVELSTTIHGHHLLHTLNVPINDPYVMAKAVAAWKAKYRSLKVEIKGQELKDYNEHRNSFFETKVNFPEDQWIVNIVLFSKGWLSFSSNKDISGETFELLKKFAAVFEQTYIRFNDLKQAEEQARESRIQLALERVRARTMAMQKSDELKYAATLLFQQAKALGVPAYSCGYNIWEKGEKKFTSWMSTQDGSDINGVPNIPLTEDANFIRYVESKQNGEPFFVLELRGERMQEHYVYLKTIPAFKAYFDYAVSVGFDLPQTQIHYIANFSQGNLLFITLEPCPEFHDVFKRFAVVFEQTYTRFLDLQKAEAQARESQIQLALERIRARTMAMQKSEELAETASVLFKQLLGLGVGPTQIRTCAIVTFHTSDPVGECWITKPDGNIVPNSFMVPYDKIPSYKIIYDTWKQGEKFQIVHLEGDALVQHMNYLKKYTSIPVQQFEAVEDRPAETYTHALFFSQGYLFIISSEPLPQYHDIFRRFGSVFQQTYTRFLDLRKAEAQAREAQIEAALERVRSRSMAMYQSTEMNDVAIVLFQQLRQLGGNLLTCGIVLCEENSTVDNLRMAVAGGGIAPTVYIPNNEEPVHKNMYEGWKAGKELYTEARGGEELKAHYDYMMTLPSMRPVLENLIASGFPLPTWQKWHAAYFSHGYLLIITLEPYVEEQTLKRLAKVFEQTYTRFLDLQKAEAQAREAQIEAALERVRSRSMGMQKSEELKEVIQVVYEQFVHLNIHVEHTGFIMDYKERDDMHIWLADKHVVPFQVTIPYFDCAHWNSFNEAKEKGKDFFANYLSLEEKNKFYQDLFKLIPGVPEETLKYYFSCPGLAISTVLLENIGLYIENFSGIPYSDEENSTLMRFGKVFQQTYTRFLDLQKAEGQAREAIRQASLDRVRGQIASMRSTEDLQRITPLIWHELTMLDVPFIRCGVLIIDETKAEAHIYLSSPDGQSLAAMNLPLQSNTLTANSVEYWRKGLVYTEHWNKEDFIHWMQSMMEQGQVQNPETYQGAAKPPESLHLHFVPFMQGMLYVGNTTLLTNDEIDLVKSLAEAFSIAYARYEDFTKLEKAKQSIELTLTELKATQTQLIQSEKMASLGELTAGIAHEIQNPLNFVNNFSEVSKELLGEMKEELDKGNTADAKEIAEDVIQNLEKINHHGKRADAIVKGMLQHSRSSTGVKEPTDINALADEYLRLAFHGLRAKDKSFNANMKTDYDAVLEKVNVIPQDIGRVILNLITNAFYTVTEKKKTGGEDYEPTVSVSTKKINNNVEIRVSDNGNGIPQRVLDKIFQPFFTTKPTGQGTGLGLSLSYDIMKAHGGEIKVETKEGEGTTFILQLPAKAQI